MSDESDERATEPAGAGGVVETARARDLRDLLRLVQGAVAFLEEVLDEDYPGWDQPARGRRRVVGAETAARYAYGQFAIAWVNLATMLRDEPGVASWSIEPLVSRSLTEPGTLTSWEIGPAGNIDIAELDVLKIDGTRVEPASLRVVRDVEPLYTIGQAQRILKGCETHTWRIELDEEGEPTGVRCVNPNCNQRRPIVHEEGP